MRSYADAEQAPEWFTTTPAKAVPRAVEKAGLKMSDIQFFEINEAFSVVGLANMQLMELDPAKVNVNGGAVSLGHPLGCSGARITGHADQRAEAEQARRMARPASATAAAAQAPW